MTESYYNTFFSLLKANRAKAFKYMESKTPLFLYKYIDDEIFKTNMSSFLQGNILANSPRKFHCTNDLFDCNPLMSKTPVDTYFYTENFRQTLLETYKNNGVQIPTCLHLNDWQSAFKEYITEYETSLSPKTKEDSWSLINKIISHHIDDIRILLCNYLFDEVKISCFTLCKDNLPMWTHYANQHKGVCIEYETSRITNNFFRRVLFPVNYTTNMINPFRIFLENHSIEEFIISSCITKHYTWKYEDEWRFVICPSCNKSFKYWHGETEDILFNFVKPTRVIFGVYAEDEFIKYVSPICKQYGVEVNKATTTSCGIDFCKF